MCVYEITKGYCFLSFVSLNLLPIIVAHLPVSLVVKVHFACLLSERLLVFVFLQTTGRLAFSR